MYTIKAVNYVYNGANDEFIVHEKDVNSKNRVYNASIVQKINEIHQFSFTINIRQPHYDNLYEKRTHLKVTHVRRSDNRTIIDFDGYISKIQEFMDADGKMYKNVVCESALGYFKDSVQTYRPFHFTNTSFVEFIDEFLSVHNSRFLTGDFRRIKRGEIENNQPTYNSFTLQYGTSFDILPYILGRFGGEYRIRTEENGLYFDYYENGISATSIGTAYPIQLAINLQSIEKFVDGTQVFNRIFPFGAKFKEIVNGTEVEREQRLSIGNPPYLESENTASFERYGTVDRIEIFEDITNDPRNATATQSAVDLLKQRAQQMVNTNSRVVTSYKISAIDLSLIGSGREFELGQRRRLIVPPMGIDETVRVTQLTIDIDNPQRSSIEVGSATRGISSLV